ncbi:MAG: tRNA 2-thiouridine synthesizing protein A [Parasphingorhabdus sp.]|jgi:tRNA 2-thiouridine synthesizing protein A
MKEIEVDARNLLCPMPVIRAQNAVAELATGDRVRVLCTDPGALNDIPAWCRINGHKLISTEDTQELITVVVEVQAES